MAKKGIFGTLAFGDTPSVVGETRNYTYTQEANEIDVTITNPGGNAAFIPGAIRHQIEVEVFYAPSDAGQALVQTQVGNDVPQTVTYNPFGDGSGNPTITGKATVMSNNLSSAADGAVEGTITFVSDAAGFTTGTLP